VIQRRGQHGNPEDYFSSKLWVDYVEGFGVPGKGELLLWPLLGSCLTCCAELWLGLDTISRLTSEGRWELMVELEDFQGVRYQALYSDFRCSVGGCSTYTGWSKRCPSGFMSLATTQISPPSATL
jgi:hypothetical protein